LRDPKPILFFRYKVFFCTEKKLVKKRQNMMWVPYFWRISAPGSKKESGEETAARLLLLAAGKNRVWR
jgi:hypothetical protein